MLKLILISVMSLSLYAADAFISADTLNKELKNPNLVLIDVGRRADYSAGHIPNAHHSKMSDYRHGVDGYQLMNSSKEIVKVMQKFGITNSSHVVIYGHGNPKEVLKSSYVALALITQGLNNVSILDGGYLEWVYETDRPVTTALPKTNKGNFKPQVNKNIVVDRHFVKNNLHKIPMLEARPATFYYGTFHSKGVKRLGHIPGAMSSYWKDKFLEDETLQSEDVLKEIFVDGYNINPKEDVLLYCTGGLEASMNWYILYQHMNFKKAKIYDGSMREWGNRTDTPMSRYVWEVYKK
jgi:thiosulfate/3-mercaptopyruvate sulfurtransferase